MTANNDMQRVMKRIKKMLQLADNNPSAEEAAVAAAMASKLMDKYNLEHADVLLTELNEDSMVAHDTGVAYARDVPPWVAAIIVSTAQLHDCEARYNHFYKDGKRSMYHSAVFLGEKSDVIVATWVFEYLLDEIKRLSTVFSKDMDGASNVERYSFRKACAIEIANTLRRMLRDKEEAMAGHSTGKDLVIRKRDLVRKKFDVNYHTGSSHRGGYGSAHAAAAGQQAGKGVNIRKGIEGSAKAGQGRLT
jgi:hypothetical protein